MALNAAVVDSVESDVALTFDRVHADYRPRIVRYLARLVGPTEAEDLAQLVFIKVSAGLSDFRGDASIRTWIYRIARNVALDWLRSTSRVAARQKGMIEADSDQHLIEEEEPSPGPDEMLARRDMQQCLGRIVQDLPASYRDILTMRDVDGLSSADVAEELGLSLAAVKIRLHRARERLRETITERCAMSWDGPRGLSCERKPPL